MSDDMISRKATIDAMENVDWYHISKDGRLVHGANSDDHEPLYKAKDVYAVLNTMSSAETHEERTETHACDYISRQDAIDALEKVAEMYLWRVPGDCDSYSQYNEAWQDALNRAESEIEALPSAQAEVLACGEGELSAQTDIIHCGDCKHRIEHKHYGDLGESAYTCEGNMVGWILPDDFCSHAKRKNGGAV